MGRAQPGPGRRPPGGLGTPGPGEALRRRQEDHHTRRRSRGDRPHRLVRADVPGQAAPRHHRLAEPEQVRLALPHRGERRQGPADGRLAVLCHQRQGAGEEPEAGLPGGLRRFRGGADHPDEAVRQGEEALPDVLVLAAVAVQEGPDDGGEAAAVQEGLRRGRGEDRLRLSAHPAPEVPQRRLRPVGRQGGRVPEEVPVDHGRPERGLADDRPGQAVPGGGGEEVGGQPPCRVEEVAALSAR
ncbi:hypothetical protein SGPA1_12367 [Streptomyces misionensis JCM 4497]